MKLLWLSAALVPSVLVLSACGGGDDGPKVTAVVELEFSDVPEGDVEGTTSRVVDIIEQRVRDLGGSDFDAKVTNQSTISFEFADLAATAAEDLLEGGSLEFMEPTLDDSGDIVCRAANGNEFHVERGSVTEGVDATGKKEAQCIGSAGETGAVVWKPAMAEDSTGETRQLTGRYVKPNSVEVVTGVGECIPACVQVEFTGEGSILFEQITTRLINYPLGIFLDEELIGAPNVQGVISAGQTIISGLSLDDAKALAACRPNS